MSFFGGAAAAAKAAFDQALEESGQDPTLLAIKQKQEAAAATIGGLDLAAVSPADATATFDSVGKDVKGGLDSMLEKAKGLSIPKVSLQSEMGGILSGASPSGAAGLADLMSKAKFPPGIEKPDIGALTAKVGAGFSVPSLGGGGLDAAISKLKGGQNPLSGLSPKGLGGGAPFDPAKMIPNLKFETRKIFDEDGAEIGTEVIATLEGVPATAPVIDEGDESAIPLYIPPKPAPVLKNPFAALSGLLAAVGKQPLSTFKGAVSTKVVTDEATGENVIMEAAENTDHPSFLPGDDSTGSELIPGVTKGPFGTFLGFIESEDPESGEITREPNWSGTPEQQAAIGSFVASGFKDMSVFNQSFTDGRAAATSKLKEATGLLREILPEATNATQQAFQAIGTANKPPPKVPADAKPIVTKKTITDPVTGIVINTSQMNAAETKFKNVAGKVSGFFDRLGLPASSGKILREPASSNITNFGGRKSATEGEIIPEQTPEEFNANMKKFGLPIVVEREGELQTLSAFGLKFTTPAGTTPMTPAEQAAFDKQNNEGNFE